MLLKKDRCVALTDGLPAVDFETIDDFERFLSENAGKASVEYICVPLSEEAKDGGFSAAGTVQALLICGDVSIVRSIGYTVYNDISDDFPGGWQTDVCFWRGDYMIDFDDVECCGEIEANIKTYASAYEVVRTIKDIVFSYSALKKIAEKILEDVEYNESL